MAHITSADKPQESVCEGIWMLMFSFRPELVYVGAALWEAF